MFVLVQAETSLISLSTNEASTNEAIRRKKGGDDMTAKEIADKWQATINSVLEIYKEASEARRYADDSSTNTICRDCVCFLMDVERLTMRNLK